MGSPLVQAPLGASPAITALGAGRIRGTSFCGRELEGFWDRLDGTIRPSGDTTRLACALARQQSHSSLRLKYSADLRVLPGKLPRPSVGASSRFRSEGRRVGKECRSRW